MNELQSLLETLADEPDARGAESVFGAAAPLAVMRRRTRRRRRVLSVCATVLVVALVVGAIVQSNTTKNGSVHVQDGGTAPAGETTAEQLAAGHWETIPSVPLAARQQPDVIWTGRAMIVWGGQSRPGGTVGPPFATDGAAYDPATKTWRMLPASPLARDASLLPVVWTGSEMVVWDTVHDSGAAYNPTTNAWRTLPAAPIKRASFALGVWTGDRVVFLGGVDGTAYDPTTNTWRSLPAATSIPGASVYFAAAAGPGRLVGWISVPPVRDGNTEFGSPSQISEYSEATGRWTGLGAPPDGIANPAVAIWTGSALLVRGDGHEPYALGPGPVPEISALYDVDTRVSKVLPPDPLTANYDTDRFSSVWTGEALLSFIANDPNPGDKGGATAYDAATSAWMQLPPAPYGCDATTPAWTGLVVLVYCVNPQPLGLPAGREGGAPVEVGGLEFVPGAANVTSAAPARVSGTFRMTGGPIGADDSLIPGTIFAVDAAGKKYQIAVGAKGDFSLSVPAGTYDIYGESPAYNNGRRCDHGSVTIVGQTTIEVDCIRF